MPTIKHVYKLILASLIIFFASANPALAGEKHIYGLHEKVHIQQLGVELNAKLDTGASTSSLSAKVLELFERDGRQWVKFVVNVDNLPSIEHQMQVVRTSRIKRRSSGNDDQQTPGYIQRPVVLLSIAMGDQQVTTEVNLTDRSHFDYPLLLGANSLEQFSALVDVSTSYQAGQPTHAPNKLDN